MFTVYDKENQSVKVYDVQRDKNGYPMFLIRQGNQWIYKSAKHYGTYQKRDKDTIKKIMCNHDYKIVSELVAGIEKTGIVKYQCSKCGVEYWK